MGASQQTSTAGAGSATDAEGDGSPDARARLLGRLAVALTLGPLLLSLLHLLLVVGGDYHPHGDLATTEMHVRDVGRHVLLVGPYSRDGWFHPGPALFYLLTVPYRLLGSSSLGLPVAALLVNGASVAGMALIARRRGGLPLLLATLVACSLLLRAFGFDFLRSAWNPSITVLPYGLLLFLTWEMACGERPSTAGEDGGEAVRPAAWALPLATGVASFLAQTHVAYVPLALPLLAIGVAALVAPALPELRRWAGWRSSGLLGALVVGGLMWLPPLYQQLTGEPGNLRRIGRYFRHAEGTQTLVEGWRVVTAQYGPSPEWLTGASDPTFLQEPRTLYSPVLPVLLVPIVLAALVLWRSGGAPARRLVGLWAAASVVGIVATARTIGLVYAYRLGWTWVLGMVGGLLLLWAGWQLLVRRRGAAAARVVAPVAVVALAGLAVVNSVAALSAGTPDEEDSRIVAELGQGVRDWLPAGDGAVVVSSSSFGALIYGGGVRLDLERHGIPAKVPDEGHDIHGRVRAYRGGPVRARLVVVVGTDIPPFLRRPDTELIAYAGSVPRRRLVELTEQQEALHARYQAGELDEDAYIRRLQGLAPTGSAVAVFAEPATPTG